MFNKLNFVKNKYMKKLMDAEKTLIESSPKNYKKNIINYFKLQNKQNSTLKEKNNHTI